MTKKDTSEYSASKAPETLPYSDEREGNRQDTRLLPGGAHGSDAHLGMEGLNRDTVPSGAVDSERNSYTDTSSVSDRKPGSAV